MTVRSVTYDDEKFALVPLEPTKSMLHAACKCLSPGRRPKEWLSVRAKHRFRYRAMVEASLETNEEPVANGEAVILHAAMSDREVLPLVAR